MQCDIAIIGAGTAGLHAYKSATAAGARVVIVDAGPAGSTCTLNGCIPSKALIAAARAAHGLREAGAFGVATGPVAVDGRAVMARVRAVRDKANGRIADQFCDIPPDHRITGVAKFVAPDRLSVGETTIAARAVIIATGSHPIVPPAFDAVRALVYTNETIFDIETLPATMAVIGAGAVGIELAQAFARLGVTVTVLDKGSTVGSLADPEAEGVARAALSDDMAIHPGVEISAAMDGTRARLDWTGASTGSVTVDLILAATGRAPNLDGLDLAVSGVALDDKGVPLFDHATRRCGDSDIFVAGDVGGWRSLLHEAARSGRIAGQVATGGAGCPPLPALAIAFTEPNMVEVGAVFGDLPDGAITGMASADRDIRSEIDRTDTGLVRLYADADGRLLGGTIVLTGGEHLGQSLALAIERGMDVGAFADQAWYHPVIEELLQDAARDVIRQISRTDR